MSAYTDAKKLQELANKQATKIQTMINTANKQALEYNAKEALKARQFNAEQGAIERAYNSAESQKARDWQKEMSDTSHQREVNDLISAGLNPVLSANSGAQSYTTSSASASAVSGPSASGSVESGAGAYSSLMSGLMGNMTSMDIAQTSANAQIRSAQISADASKYVAEMNYKAQMDKPQASIAGLIDKYFGKFFGTEKNQINSNAKSTWSKFMSGWNNLSKSTKNNLIKGGKFASADTKNIAKMAASFGLNFGSIKGSTRTALVIAMRDLANGSNQKYGLEYLSNLYRNNPKYRIKK